MVRKELIQQLRQIFREDYKKEIDFKEASQVADFLVMYFDTLSKINKRLSSEKTKQEKLY